MIGCAVARALVSYKDLVGVLVDSWGYLSADYADLENYADFERMELDCLTSKVIGCAIARALVSYKVLVGVLVDSWGYLGADYADLEDYTDLERMELDCLNGK